MPEPYAPQPTNSSTPDARLSAESDLAELASMFAAHGGNGLPPQVSADLALEIVLHEIVEQACLATGATGAAVVLLRDGEMVCRASSGVNAPALGARLVSESGLTAECMRTQQVQRCDDAQNDPRADAEASRSLGVRSVMIFPLLRGAELLGVVEIFSARPAAFGERDKLTLEVLASRILKNLQRASEPVAIINEHSIAAQAATPQSATFPSVNVEELSADGTYIAASHPHAHSAYASHAHEKPAVDPPNCDTPNVGRQSDPQEPEFEPRPWVRRKKFDWLGFALGGAILACTVLLATMVGVRLGWHSNVRAHTEAAKKATDPVSAGQLAAGPAGAEASSLSSVPSTEAPIETTNSDPKTNLPTTPAANGMPAPAGSLFVYENGKEVFRMLPRTLQNDKSGKGTIPASVNAADPAVAANTKNRDTSNNAATNNAASEVRQASAVEAAGVMDLPSEAATRNVVHRVEPEYPEQARQQGIQGAVVLDVRIASDGRVQQVNVVGGPQLLADAAVAAVKQWQFEPHVANGQPVEMQTRVTLNFRMPQ
jgi:TonB family protein